MAAKTGGQRRTIAQRKELAAGRHPLGLFLGQPLALHSEAASAEDLDAAGRRCGSCLFLTGVSRDRRCGLDEARLSGGPRARIKGTWPGCVDHRYADGTKVGADA